MFMIFTTYSGANWPERQSVIMKIIMQILVIVLLLPVLSSAQDRSSYYGQSSSLKVIHTPLSISDVPKDLLDRLDYPYVRFYRTDVINKTDRPIKIVWFDNYFKREKKWLASNIRNKVLKNKDFLDWYGNNNVSTDGWLRPGGTASCTVNWHVTDTPQDIKAKWAFIGVDDKGNDYFSEAVVPKIKPVKMK